MLLTALSASSGVMCHLMLLFSVSYTGSSRRQSTCLRDEIRHYLFAGKQTSEIPGKRNRPSIPEAGHIHEPSKDEHP